MIEQTVQKSDSPARVSIIGVPISAVNLESSVRYIEDNLEDAKGNCLTNYIRIMAYGVRTDRF